MGRRIRLLMICLGVFALLGAILLPAFTPASNCGGNSAAIDACRTIFTVTGWATNTNGSGLDLTQLDAVDRTNLLSAATTHWTPGAGYWLRTNGREPGAAKCIAVVCDATYSNVPQPTMWNFYRKTPAHAVAYSDGTFGLISPSEFQALHRNGFVSVTFMATNDVR